MFLFLVGKVYTLVLLRWDRLRYIVLNGLSCSCQECSVYQRLSLHNLWFGLFGVEWGFMTEIRWVPFLYPPKRSLSNSWAAYHIPVFKLRD